MVPTYWQVSRAAASKMKCVGLLVKESVAHQPKRMTLSPGSMRVLTSKRRRTQAGDPPLGLFAEQNKCDAFVICWSWCGLDYSIQWSIHNSGILYRLSASSLNEASDGLRTLCLPSPRQIDWAMVLGTMKRPDYSQPLEVTLVL